MLITLTKQLIEDANPSAPGGHPIAQAIYKATGLEQAIKNIVATQAYIIADGKYYLTPKRIRDWMRTYDHWYAYNAAPPEPMTFEIPDLDQWRIVQT